MFQKKENISFRKVVQPLEKISLSERIKDDCIIESVNIRFYPGVERALQVRPYIMHNGGKMEDLFTYSEGTETYLSGDDDTFNFNVSMYAKYDEFIKVDVFNSNDTYPYTLVIDFVVSYLSNEVIL